MAACSRRSGVTLRRLLVGYAIGLAIGLPLGLLSSRRSSWRTRWACWRSGCRRCRACAGSRSRCSGSARARARCCSSSSWARPGRSSSRQTPARAPSRPSTPGRRGPWAPTGFHQWTRVVVPASLPFLVSGMKQGWAFAWRSLMAAEIYVTILSGFGLGQLLHYGRELNAMEQVIAIMLVIVLIGLAGRQGAVRALGAIPAPPLGHGRKTNIRDKRPRAVACRGSESGAPEYAISVSCHEVRRGRRHRCRAAPNSATMDLTNQRVCKAPISHHST